MGHLSLVRAIVRRELLALFATSVAWVTLGLLTLLLGAIFVVATLRTGEPATLRAVLLAAGWALLAAAPAISMRSFAEEFRQGTWETLLAAPIRPWHAVVGKFIAGVVLVATLVLVPTVACGLVLELHADPDWGEMACGAVGLILAGSSFLAVGIVASTLTSNQLVAFLVPVFSLFVLALGSRALASILPASWAPAAFAIDPLRRVEDFVLGLVDTANLVYFVAVTAAALSIASLCLGSVREGGFGGGARSGLGRGLFRIEAFLFALGAMAAAGAVAALAGTPLLRGELDATKTRAYTLSPSTSSLVAGLDGDWSIAALIATERADPGSLRRVDEVLERFADANPRVHVERIDPDSPAAAHRYDELLERLAQAYAEPLRAWEPVLAASFERYDALRAFARREQAAIATVLAAIPADDQSAAAVRSQLEQIGGGLLQLTNGGETFGTSVRDLVRTNPSRPLPDHDGARSALAANDRLWVDQCSTVAALAKDWARRNGLPEVVRAWATAHGANFEEEAKVLRTDQDALEALPPLALGDVGRVLASGECAVVLSPHGAIAIPSWQFVPSAQAGPGGSASAGRGRLGFDFAARAEQVLAGAIRSLTVERMPLVVFVHCEDHSLLANAPDRNDVVAVADTLRSARFSVREWSVVGGERPVPARGQPVVWAIIPPLRREGLQLSDRERRLLELTGTLFAEGQPLLITVARNLLPVFGQRDPWSMVADLYGLTFDTGRVVLELVPVAADRLEPQAFQLVEKMSRQHPIGAAVNGQATMLNHPTPIQPAAGNAAVAVIAAIEPSPDRWLEDDWRENSRVTREVPDAKRFTTPLPVVVAVERKDQATGVTRRAVVVGSGGWLLSSLADVAQSLGGNRVVLTNPGNRELLLASVAWLAGIDLLGGSAGREVARVDELTDSARAFWFVLLVGGVPALVGLVGVGVWWRRRRDA